MSDPKESTDRTVTNTEGQDKSWNKNSDGHMGTSANNQSNYSSNQGQCGDMPRNVNTRNNRNSADMGTPNKDTSGEIETFGAVLVLRYEKVEIKKSLYVSKKS